MSRCVALAVVLGATAGCYAHERDAPPDAGSAIDASAPTDASSATDAFAPPDAFVAADAGLDASTCRTLRADEWIAPDVVRVGDPVPALMRANAGASCGCVPSGDLATPEGPNASFRVCDCSDLDPCVDPGYDATIVGTPSAHAEQRQFYHPYAGGRVIIEVADPGACAPSSTVESIELVSPDGAHLVSAPHWWVRVRGTEMRCCGTPAVALAADTMPGARTTITLAALECAPDPCECASGAPTPYDTVHDLGPLAPGGYDVLSGTGHLALDVP